ncbi:GumC family protein [Croceibacter atlanticus]|uniref:GumC family protein n=1 Tax=Croceibacter atlanticus TaxID=313588 RepID=UPI002E122413|nr:polysaccharide biosynthesis tyrosine autokinase [Croceibacter atlanticus]|tara:strand:+ start:23699 stop:26089 length:2391 start_codon:yes stop_codon:yes gene_type:complete
MNSTSNSPIFKEEDNNLREEIDKYLFQWKWFVLGVIITLTGAFLYLRYSTPIYQSTATILVKDEKKGEASILEDLSSGTPGFSSVNVEDEIQILKSKNLMSGVVDDLNLTTQYLLEGNIKTVELYNSQPFDFTFIGQDSLGNQGYSRQLEVEPISNSKYKIKEVSTETSSEHSFGDVVNLGFGKFTIVPNKTNLSENNSWINKKYIVRLLPQFSAINKYQSALTVENTGRRSSVISLSMQSENSKKSEDILNNIIKQFNNDAIVDKNLVSENTFNFIAERLEIIQEELDSVETNKKEFQTENKITDIPSEAQLYVEDIREIQKSRVEVETQLELIKYIKDYLTDTNRSSDLLPANLGVTDSGIESYISEYNQLVIQRNNQLQTGTASNPIVINLNNQIDVIKSNILASLNNKTKSLEVKRRDIVNQQNNLDSKISSVPKNSLIFRDITRQQNIKENLFLYLLQKREETAISLAITAPSAKVIDDAYSSRSPIFPKKQIIYLAAFILGIIIPFLIIYVKNLLDNKIHNRADVEKETKLIPILGEVPKIDTKESETVGTNDRSILAEAFRILRTNLSYFVKSIKGEEKNIIFVTSTVKGEGKTFVAFNLALTLSTSDKKVLLIGSDIRNPQLHRYIDRPEQSKGLSEYLYDEKVTIESVTDSYKINKKDISIILSGRIPPNPAELLMRDRFKNLLEEVKDKYDYVVVDTAPTMLVTDTLLISQHADFTVYVTRAEYTDKRLLKFPVELYHEKKLRNMAFVVNNVSVSNYGYGNKYGYGYTYGAEKETFFTKLNSKLRF